MKNTILTALFALALFACGGSATDADPAAAPADTTAIQRTASPGLPQPDTTIANGPVEVKYPDGTVRIKGNMLDHKRHGMWSSHFPDGRPQSYSSYVNGELNGTTVVYRPNGSIYYTGDYNKGKQVGDWRFYDENGTLERTVSYDSEGTVINDRK